MVWVDDNALVTRTSELLHQLREKTEKEMKTFLSQFINNATNENGNFTEGAMDVDEDIDVLVSCLAWFGVGSKSIADDFWREYHSQSPKNKRKYMPV